MSGSVRRVAIIGAMLSVAGCLVLAAAPLALADTAPPAPASSSPFSVGVLIVALVLLSGVLVLTRPKRPGR